MCVSSLPWRRDSKTRLAHPHTNRRPPLPMFVANSLARLAAQYTTCTRRKLHEQLHKAPFWVVAEKRRLSTTFSRSDRGAPTQHGCTPTVPTQ